MARFFPFPGDDREQGVRFRRYLIAVGTSLTWSSSWASACWRELVWFSFMGGYVHDLRRRLRESGYDRLTGIHNRGRVLDLLDHEKIRGDRGAGPMCVCLDTLQRADAALYRAKTAGRNRVEYD